MLEELKSGELAAGEIGARFAISAPSISRHLAILRGAELVNERREGNRILYRLEPATLRMDRVAGSALRECSARNVSS